MMAQRPRDLDVCAFWLPGLALLGVIHTPLGDHLPYMCTYVSMCVGGSVPTEQR